VNHLFDPGEREDEREDGRNSAPDREISLGIPTILGIFFALALVCAGFFGFGYGLGRKSGQNAAAVSGGVPASASFGVKPAAGSVAGPPSPVRAAAAPPPAAVQAPATASVAPTGTYTAGDRPAAGIQPSTTGSQPAISPTGTFMVQIAAVSSQDIADIETTALKKYGYDVVVRHEPQDQLLHVQIGPFATRKDAEAMRQNVLAHGFNAIVK
jgi:cell division septation protein DedD